MRGGGTSLAARLIPASSETKVLLDDLAALLVVGVQPAANSLGRKASIRERTDERPSWAQHAGHIGEHFYGSGEVVDGNAAHHCVEGLVGERQAGLGVEVVDDGSPCQGVRIELVRVHPEHREVRGWGAEVRDPRTHQIEHVAGDPKFVIEGTDRSDGLVVEVGDQARPRVETRIAGPVNSVEETEREGAAVHLLSLPRLPRQTRRTAQTGRSQPLRPEILRTGAGPSTLSRWGRKGRTRNQGPIRLGEQAGSGSSSALNVVKWGDSP